MERARRRRANPGYRIAQRFRSGRRRARGDGRGRRLARGPVGGRLARCHARTRRARPCRRTGAGADRANLRGVARSDRERYRRADRSDFRASRANSCCFPTWSTRRPKATPKFRTRRSRSRTGSSISAGWRPMRCISRSIPIRAGRTRFLSRRSRSPTPAIIRLPRSRHCTSMHRCAAATDARTSPKEADAPISAVAHTRKDSGVIGAIRLSS